MFLRILIRMLGMPPMPVIWPSPPWSLSVSAFFVFSVFAAAEYNSLMLYNCQVFNNRWFGGLVRRGGGGGGIVVKNATEWKL